MIFLSETPYPIFDLLDLIFSAIGGILLTSLAFLLTYRSPWRDYITGEFKVRLELDFISGHNNRVTSVRIRCEINCNSSDEFAINYIYLKLPKSVRGNYRGNSTLDEVLKGTGHFYIGNEINNFKHSYWNIFDISNEIILNSINNNQLKKLILVVNSSKYGNVCSNKVKIK